MDRLYLRHTFQECSRCVLLLSLVYAPWAYGCTYPWTSLVLDGILATALLLWIAACILGKKMPRLLPVPVISSALLILLGTFMAWNSHFQHDPIAHRFTRITPIWANLPGSIDATSVWSHTRHAALMLGSLLLAADAARGKTWRRRFLFTMALVGASIALFGLIQRATAASMIFWLPGHSGSLFFATYFYHGNAGAFLNLVLPLIAAHAAHSFQGDGNTAKKSLWLPSLVICLAAVVVNVSRAASFIGILLFAAIVLFELRHLCRKQIPLPRFSVAISVLLLGVALWAVSASSGSSQALEKWGWLERQLNANNPRYIVANVCLSMAKDSRLWGFGPGTFGIAFPHYTSGTNEAIRGIWRYAHQDYLQTFIEWGAIGTVAWLAILFGGIWRIFFSRGNPENNFLFRFACGLALTGIALHALVDFPFQIASLQLYAMMLLGISWSRAEITAPTKGDRQKRQEALLS